jgi:hypothetical protein
MRHLANKLLCAASHDFRELAMPLITVPIPFSMWSISTPVWAMVALSGSYRRAIRI